MKILLVSNEDACRSRIAEILLQSYGRGMMIGTAGISEANRVPDVVAEVMAENGFDVSCVKPVSIATQMKSTWDYVITLSDEAADEVKLMSLGSVQWVRFSFTDALANGTADETELRVAIQALYEEMDRVLYRFYRDTLREELLPRCTCGANTYCRCE